MYRRQQQHYKQPTIRTFMLFCLLNFWLFSPSLILMGKCFQQKFKYVFTFFCSSNLLFPFHPNFQSFLAVLFLFFFTQNVKFLSRWFHLYVWDVWGVFFFGHPVPKFPHRPHNFWGHQLKGLQFSLHYWVLFLKELEKIRTSYRVGLCLLNFKRESFRTFKS